MTISNFMKTLWEKEKLLVTSNFSFSHSGFKKLVLQKCKIQGLFGKGLTLPIDKNLDQPKLKVDEFANNKMNGAEKLYLDLAGVANIVLKGDLGSTVYSLAEIKICPRSIDYNF